jgi:hypothetical protein
VAAKPQKTASCYVDFANATLPETLQDMCCEWYLSSPKTQLHIEPTENQLNTIELDFFKAWETTAHQTNTVEILFLDLYENEAVRHHESYDPKTIQTLFGILSCRS